MWRFLLFSIAQYNKFDTLQVTPGDTIVFKRKINGFSSDPSSFQCVHKLGVHRIPVSYDINYVLVNLQDTSKKYSIIAYNEYGDKTYSVSDDIKDGINKKDTHNLKISSCVPNGIYFLKFKIDRIDFCTYPDGILNFEVYDSLKVEHDTCNVWNTDNDTCKIEQTVGICIVSGSFDKDFDYSISTKAENCDFSDGSYILRAVGGTLPYTHYLYYNSLSQIFTDSLTISDLIKGNYSFLITDFNNCQRNGKATINRQPNDYYYDNITTILGTNEVWNSDRKIAGMVEVKNNSTLTINNNSIIEFADGQLLRSRSGIIVYPGSKLIIEQGAILTGLEQCNTMWEGIKVYGNSSSSYSGNPYNSNYTHGFVHIKNNASIKNAKAGIQSGEIITTLTPVVRGGVVWADNATFYNNLNSIILKDTKPLKFNSINRIKGCNFIGNGFLKRSNRGIDAFIYLETIRNVNFAGNLFTSSGISDKRWRGTGIRSFNASYIVDAQPGSTHTISGSSVGVKNNFSGLTKGIDTYSSGELGNNITVKNSSFANVQQGITANGTAFDEIRGNEFDIPGSTASNPTWGVYLYNTSGFTLVENSFKGHYSGLSSFEQSYGAISRNSSSFTSLIKDNNFYNVQGASTQAEQDNTNLQILCNIYGDNAADWIVTSGRLRDQGECMFNPQNPAGNEFSKNCFKESHINSAIGFTYWHHAPSVNDSRIVKPICYSDIVNLKSCSKTLKQNPCMPYSNGAAPGGTDSKIPDNIINNPNLTERELLITDFIKQLLQDDNVPVMVVANILEKLDREDANKILVPTFLMNNDFGNCRRVLNKIPTDNLENIQYHRLFNNLVEYCEQNTQLGNMPDTDKNIIRDVANTDSKVSVQAESFLTRLDNTIEYNRSPEDINNPISKFSKSHHQNEAEDEKTSNIYTNMLLYNTPNPFGINTTIHAVVDEDFKAGQVIICDLMGRELAIFHIKKGNNEIVIEAEKYQNGIYLYKLVLDGKVYFNRKMVVAKD